MAPGGREAWSRKQAGRAAGLCCSAPRTWPFGLPTGATSGQARFPKGLGITQSQDRGPVSTPPPAARRDSSLSSLPPAQADTAWCVSLCQCPWSLRFQEVAGNSHLCPGLASHAMAALEQRPAPVEPVLGAYVSLIGLWGVPPPANTSYPLQTRNWSQERSR